VCQCLTTATVESMIVPSMSNNSPENESIDGAALNVLRSTGVEALPAGVFHPETAIVVYEFNRI
jgi:hypothetical protein